MYSRTLRILHLIACIKVICSILNLAFVASARNIGQYLHTNEMNASSISIRGYCTDYCITIPYMYIKDRDH